MTTSAAQQSATSAPDFIGSSEPCLGLHPEPARRGIDRLLVQLADGSSFYLDADKVLIRAAEMIANHGIPHQVHLREQLLPAVSETPGLLINIASQLPWIDAFTMAAQPFWQSPVRVTGAKLWARAKITQMSARRT